MAYTDDPIAAKMYDVGNAPIDTSIMSMGFIGHPTDKDGYTARGYDQGGEVMTKEQAMALMNNQPEPMPMPMARPDELYDEIMMEQVGPLARPQLKDPYGADRTFSPYDMLRPDNAPNT
jgi:hypothetical protein